MMVLNNEEMMNIQGGGFNLKLVAGVIGAAVAFIIGVVDGIINPNKCN